LSHRDDPENCQALVEADIEVEPSGTCTLRRAFAVGGQWFAEIDAGNGSGAFVTPLRVWRIKESGSPLASQAPPSR
jgi:hypothetical protein